MGELQSSKHLRNQRTINMNSMVMSTRKAVVARPTQSRKVASKATRRPVMMAGMQVLKPEKKYECLSYLPPLSDADISKQVVLGRQRMVSMHRVRFSGGG